jgi:hypothetical protein
MLRYKASTGGKLIIALYSPRGKRLARDSVIVSDDSDGEDVAADMLSSINKLVSRKISKSKRSSTSSTRKKLASYTDVKNRIKDGLRSYAKGDLSEAISVFNEAATELKCGCSQNKIAADLLRSAKTVASSMSKAEEFISAGNYKMSETKLKAAQSADNKVRNAGYKMMMFKKERTVRRKYLMPNSADASAVASIHRQFKQKIDSVY